MAKSNRVAVGSSERRDIALIINRGCGRALDSLGLRDRRVEPGCDFCKGGRRTAPTELIDVIEERDVGPERGESSKQQGALPLTREGQCKSTCAGGIHAPLAPVRRDGFEVKKLSENCSGRFGPPPWQARIPVGRVTYQRQIVRDGRRRYTKLLDHSRLIVRDAGSAIQLDDAGALDALGEVLVGRADNHALDTGIARRRCRRCRERIVRFKLHHRPNHHARRGQGVFKERELRQKAGFNALAGLVAWP